MDCRLPNADCRLPIEGKLEIGNPAGLSTAPSSEFVSLELRRVYWDFPKSITPTSTVNKSPGAVGTPRLSSFQQQQIGRVNIRVCLFVGGNTAIGVDAFRLTFVELVPRDQLNSENRSHEARVARANYQ